MRVRLFLFIRALLFQHIMRILRRNQTCPLGIRVFLRFCFFFRFFTLLFSACREQQANRCYSYLLQSNKSARTGIILSADAPVSTIFYFYSIPAELYSSISAFTSSPSSSSCFASAGVGASVIRQEASLIFGNAITSRMLSCFAMSMTRRSRP